MLQINKSRVGEPQTFPIAEFVTPAEIYAATIGFVRRRFSVILFVFVLILALGAVYLFTSPPRYTGHAVLLIDTQQSRFLQSQAPLGDAPLDSATVDTQIEIIKSQNIASSVIKDLHLNEDPEFIAPRAGFVGTIMGLAVNTVTSALNFIVPTADQGGNAPSPDFRRMQTALTTFESRLSVTRVGLTYAINIDFQSYNPDRAAQIANAVADAYVVDSLEAKYQTTKRAAIWLQDRLKELREQSTAAERAVVAYKTKNNIVDTGGRLLGEQQLAELNSALIQAQAATAEAKARYDQVQQILNGGDVDPATAATATVADTLHNDVITKLREQYLEMDARESEWAAKYGATHLAVVNLRNQMAEIRRTIYEELQQIAQTYKSDYDIAVARQQSVQNSLNKVVGESQTTNEAQITLRDLQSSAETYRALYDNFLQRYMESVQAQSFPISDARLITSASRPLSKSAPKPGLVLALAGLTGLILGGGLGMLRDIADRVFRSTGQISDHLDANCVAVIPLIKGLPSNSASRKAHRGASVPGTRTITRDTSLRWTVVDSPLSRFTESVRAIKVAVDLSNAAKANKVIGITSSLPNEGKSTIAVSLAGLIAHGGGRAVLVDCDLRKPALSRALAPDAQAGLLELITGKAALEDVVWNEPSSGLAFLPAVVPSRLNHASEILASAPTRKLFEKLRETYDYVIVDLSPLAPVVDVRVMTPLVDSFLFAVEWGRTKFDVAEHALGNAQGVHDNLLGVVLNKADMNALGRYEGYRGNYYYKRYYARYGYTS
ncbi:MAG TPA: polysaccharide biosynthesis tyrosine autokinase [Xanthobacteraceae bacterium]|nr:polysaccharide biosynthesis tyrosine autokinase [Xanthobacteraceae bacterium]